MEGKVKITKMTPTCDLSELALEDAALQLPPSKLYRIQIHPYLLSVARNIISYKNPADISPLAPTISIELAPFEKQGHWALWSGDECVWSPGA